MSDLREAAVDYTDRLRKTLGERLRSVLLHGSVARGEAVPGLSDVNLLVLVDDVEPPLLRELAPDARRWLDRRGALPLVLEWSEWQGASDAFAIETADMIDAHELLHGEDPLEGATIATRHLRLQAERELRGKLIHLREGIMLSAERPRDLGRLLMAALPSLAAYFRAALRLSGEPVPARTPDTLARGGELVGAEPDPLIGLWEIRSGGKPPRLDTTDPRVAAVHRSLEKTVEYVDTYTGEPS